jgi:hypothetical protein
MFWAGLLLIIRRHYYSVYIPQLVYADWLLAGLWFSYSTITVLNMSMYNVTTKRRQWPLTTAGRSNKSSAMTLQQTCFQLAFIMLYGILRLANNVCVMSNAVNCQTFQEFAISSSQCQMTLLLNRTKYCLMGYSTLKYHITLIPHVTIPHLFPWTHNNF